jgi:hypothetical protein
VRVESGTAHRLWCPSDARDGERQRRRKSGRRLNQAKPRVDGWCVYGLSQCFTSTSAPSSIYRTSTPAIPRARSLYAQGTRLNSHGECVSVSGSNTQFTPTHGPLSPATYKELIGMAGRANVSSKLMDAATLSSTVASALVTAAEDGRCMVAARTSWATHAWHRTQWSHACRVPSTAARASEERARKCGIGHRWTPCPEAHGGWDGPWRWRPSTCRAPSRRTQPVPLTRSKGPSDLTPCSVWPITIARSVSSVLPKAMKWPSVVEAAPP